MNSIEAATAYIARGYSPVPIPAREKAPLVKKWQTLRIVESDVHRHFKPAGNIGIILGEASRGLVDIDLDCPEACKFAPEILPKTAAVFGRASKPLSHVLYRIEGVAPTRKFVDPVDGSMMVELRGDGGLQTIFPPSIHPSGEPVTWRHDGEPAIILFDDLLRDVKRLAARVVVERHGDGSATDDPTTWFTAVDGAADKVKETVAEWLGIKLPGAGTFRRPDAAADRTRHTGGSKRQDAYARAALEREVAAVASAGKGGRNDQLNRSALNLGTLIGAGLLGEHEVEAALLAAARACGLSVSEAKATIRSGLTKGKDHPREMPEPDGANSESPSTKKGNGRDRAQAAPANTVLHGGALKRVVTLNDLNARFALLEQDGSPSVYINRRDFLPIQDQDLKRRLAGEVVAIGAKDGKPIYGGAFNFWTGHAARHLYRHVAFTNQALPDDTLNLFRGLGVTPKQGSFEKIIRHVQEVICSGNFAVADALLKLLGWQIQNIGKPSRIVVVLKSQKQQAGKGILLGELMAKIYGPSGFVAATADQILGRFNSAIRGRAFVFLDEVLFAGDRKAADGIKSLATATIIGIEEKGLPIVQCPVAVNLWLASNHDNAAHIEEHDARYWPLEVSPHRVGDAAYFTSLMQEIENGGREAFADYLLNLDVRDFVPSRDCPKDNDAKAAMIRLSLNPFDARKWLEECCLTERLIGRKLPDSEGWAEWTEGEELYFATLRDAYVEWQKNIKSPVAPTPTPTGNLGEILSRAGLSIRRTGAGNRRILPATVDCLAALWRADDDTN